jgi:hypothetical protein
MVLHTSPTRRRRMGKRTERLRIPKQMRLDFEMAQTIRLTAEQDRRSVPAQILHFVEQGIKARFEPIGHKAAHIGTPRRVTAQEEGVA